MRETPNIFPLPSAGDYDRIERMLLRSLRSYVEYEVDVKRWYRDGDGRPVSDGGRGYVYPRCIHGMSSWTDYDNICGGCEAGYNRWDYTRELDDASRDLAWAHSEVRRRAPIAAAILQETGLWLSQEARSEIANWAIAPIENL